MCIYYSLVTMPLRPDPADFGDTTRPYYYYYYYYHRHITLKWSRVFKVEIRFPVAIRSDTIISSAERAVLTVRSFFFRHVTRLYKQLVYLQRSRLAHDRFRSTRNLRIDLSIRCGSAQLYSVQ